MKETKTVQVYPSDDIVNATIEEYESFGWEVVGNQRCQEYNGQTHGIDGSTVSHYSTFNKITFTREKSSSWYEEVSALEREYNVLKDTRETYKNCKPVLRKPRPEGSVGVALGYLLFMLFFLPGFIYVIVRGVKRSKYKKIYKQELAEYESIYPARISELSDRLSQLRTNAQNAILKQA